MHKSGDIHFSYDTGASSDELFWDSQRRPFCNSQRRPFCNSQRRPFWRSRHRPCRAAEGRLS
ncbi:hypothetical protein COCON_G00233330 [Conger conger]|uniref:Uncharacterized protein n=1 Tax=Conger conger TaxID=82655 RepID=A0A9Q1CWE3_CONCO|nr:hypothetical protein COCON_G00233330 [Conger conger]